MSFDLKQYLINLSTKIKQLEERSTALEERNHQLEARLHGMENKVSQMAVQTPHHPPATEAPRPFSPPPPPPPPPPVHSHSHSHGHSAEDGLKAIAEGLISSTPLPTHTHTGEEILKTLLDASGKANYLQLKKLAREKGDKEFHEIFHHPVLMGAALLRGTAEAQTDSGDVDATVMFTGINPRKIQEDDKVRMDMLERSIYPLYRRRPVMPGSGVTPVISIGRNDENDIVMPDPTISKKQAEIRINHEGITGRSSYILRDLGSTNEIRINGNKVNSFDMVELNPGDEIKLGRFFFIFTPVSRLRKKLLED
ncbi:MAG: FHA domain-containing protein [Magnetococcales bacterium]|nr:FHA domain-containing protein [Magnetococcales bacterium]NGZ26397.1 FHA domain-containing protein [Magnetococcales bacterium]